VVAPVAAVGARVLDGAGQRVADHDLAGGVALVPAPPGAAAVRTLAADGSLLEELPVMGTVDLSRT
jgi:hypothetical protein